MKLLIKILKSLLCKKEGKMETLRVFTRDQKDKQISTHFKAGEFFCNCGKCHNQFIDMKLVAKLELLREILGKPIHINSGFRCEAHNKKIGGKKNSQHPKGRAADIVVKGVDIDTVRKEADKYFNGMGIYKTFTHVDVRDGKKARWNK